MSGLFTGLLFHYLSSHTNIYFQNIEPLHFFNSIQFKSVQPSVFLASSSFFKKSATSWIIVPTKPFIHWSSPILNVLNSTPSNTPLHSHSHHPLCLSHHVLPRPTVLTHPSSIIHQFPHPPHSTFPASSVLSTITPRFINVYF